MSVLPPDDDRTVMAPRHLLAGRPTTGDPRECGNALPAGTLLDELELQSVIGEGGFGIVYLAWDRSLERQVALKEYMPSALASRSNKTQVQVKSERQRETFEIGLKSFVNEARLLAQFNHPSLVKVYRFWEANGTAYMLMPFYEGVTLKDKLGQLTTPPEEAWLLDLLDPLTEALAVIHAESCYHRDIAPDNIILLAPSGRPLLLDFGAARRVIGDMTQALTVILKPGYAPVEQYAEAPHMKQGPWTDVYALAASIYFAITGKNVPPAVGRVMRDSYQPLTQTVEGRYSAGFLQALDKALRVRPEERTQTIDEFRQDLGLRAAQVEPQQTRVWQAPAPPADSPPPKYPAHEIRVDADEVPPAVMAARPSKRKPLWLGTGAILLSGGLWGTYLFLQSPSVNQEPPPSPAVVAQLPPPIETPAPAAPQLDNAPPPPGAPPRFDVREEFDKVLAGRDTDFGVEAQPVKDQLKIGKDRLSFTVKSDRDGFVHVLLLGADGSLMLFYPNTEARSHRIRAGQTLTLPQDRWALETAEPAGTEHFLVIVSEQPRSYAALSKEHEYYFLKLPTTLDGHPSKTSRLLGDAQNCKDERCNVYGASYFAVEVMR